MHRPRSQTRVATNWSATLFALSFWVALHLAPQSVPAESFKWTAPTPAELSMTSDPKAPGAPAVILSYEETDDGDSAEVLVHARIKVLTEAGRSAGNIETPARIVINDEFNKDFYARTIHPDGTVVPYVSTPTNSHVMAVNQVEVIRVAALQDVTVGSIVEYGYHFAGQNTIYTHLVGRYHPTWIVQRKYFLRAARFTLKTPSNSNETDTRWVASLPPGAELKHTRNRVTLDVENVPPEPEEEFMPPPTSVLYNVRFFYYADERDKFWGEVGAKQDDYWSYFDTPRKAINSAIHELIQPTDTDDVKLHKLYDAVQRLENTDLTRARTEREDKLNGLKEANNSDDIWTRRRGDSDELTLLFVAFAEAAGYQAYPMGVASRDKAIFSQDVLSWSQLDSVIAIVIVNGHERFFDPGVRCCPFGHLAPWHSNVMGVSIEGKLVKIRSTPGEPASASRIDRLADLTIDAGGGITGTVRISWYANAGLSLRRKAVIDDEQAVRSSIEHQTQAELPAGAELKLQSLEALADPTAPLVAKFTVSGRIGMSTAKRLVIPAHFFASNAKPILAVETRSEPVAFPSAYTARDQMILHLPAGLSAETMPAAPPLSLGSGSGSYTVRVQPPAQDPQGQNFLIIQRIAVLNRLDYKPEEYGQLHKYFGRVANYDQDQIVLMAAAPPAAGN